MQKYQSQFFFVILPPQQQNEISKIRWESVTELAIFEGITYRNITVKLPITFTAHISNSEYSDSNISIFWRKQLPQWGSRFKYNFTYCNYNNSLNIFLYECKFCSER